MAVVRMQDGKKLFGFIFPFVVQQKPHILGSIGQAVAIQRKICSGRLPAATDWVMGVKLLKLVLAA